MGNQTPELQQDFRDDTTACDHGSPATDTQSHRCGHTDLSASTTVVQENGSIGTFETTPKIAPESSCDIESTSGPRVKEHAQAGHLGRIYNRSRANEGTNIQPRRWRPTIFRPGPLSGMVGMVFACLSIIAALGILIASDGDDVRLWNVPPSTYLAIFTAVANVAMRYACIQGEWTRDHQTPIDLTRE